MQHPTVHILLVEDVLNTLELMRDYLKKEYPDAEIYAAQTVNEANELIERTSRRGIKFKIAILDFKLPKGKGAQPEVETELRDRLRGSISRDAVVFHITAFPTDARIQKYINEEQLRNPRSSRPLLISKLESDWPEKLYKAVAQVIHGDRIVEQMNRLFGGGIALSPLTARGRLGPATFGDPTHDLAGLMRDIEAHWHDLDDDLRKSIRGIFHVHEGKEQATVSLF